MMVDHSSPRVKSAGESNGGWIKLYWKLKDSVAGSSAVSTGVWVHILLRVSHRPKVLRNGTKLEPGDVLLSEVRFAEEMGVSRKVMRRLINLFESEGMIEIRKRDRNGTRLSVCNWRTYQDSDGAKGQQRNRSETETGQQRNNNEPQTESPKIPKSPHPPLTPPELEDVPAQPHLPVEEGEWVGWEGAAARLRSLDVGLYDKAIEAAQRNGATLSMVHAAIEWYIASPGAWEPGALYTRIVSLAPGVDPTASWPPESEQYLRRQAAAAKLATDRRQADEQKCRRRRYVETRSEEEKLEREWGSTVDALPRETAENILRRDAFDMGPKWIREWEPGARLAHPLARSYLIDAVRDGTVARVESRTAAATPQEVAT